MIRAVQAKGAMIGRRCYHCTEAIERRDRVYRYADSHRLAHEECVTRGRITSKGETP